MRKTGLVLVVFVSVVTLSWGQIKVLESSGSGGGDKNQGETTTIRFELMEGEEKEEVSIYQILSESVMYASGPGGTASGSGQTQRIVCYAPAVIELDGGMYRFGITGNTLIDAKFDIFAGGGEQVWEVSYGKPSRAILGITGSILGFSAGIPLTIIGISNANTMYSWEEDGNEDPDTGLIVGGLICFGASIWLMIDAVNNFPEANLVEKR